MRRRDWRVLLAATIWSFLKLWCHVTILLTEETRKSCPQGLNCLTIDDLTSQECLRSCRKVKCWSCIPAFFFFFLFFFFLSSVSLLVVLNDSSCDWHDHSSTFFVVFIVSDKTRASWYMVVDSMSYVFFRFFTCHVDYDLTPCLRWSRPSDWLCRSSSQTLLVGHIAQTLWRFTCHSSAMTCLRECASRFRTENGRIYGFANPIGVQSSSICIT